MTAKVMSKKYIKDVFKFQKPSFGSNQSCNDVLMYNKDRSIMGQLPMNQVFELIFGDKLKVYCECKYRNSDGYLKIGKEVKANW